MGIAQRIVSKKPKKMVFLMNVAKLHSCLNSLRIINTRQAKMSEIIISIGKSQMEIFSTSGRLIKNKTPKANYRMEVNLIFQIFVCFKVSMLHISSCSSFN